MTIDSINEMKAMNSWNYGYGMIMFKFKFTNMTCHHDDVLVHTMNSSYWHSLPGIQIARGQGAVGTTLDGAGPGPESGQPEEPSRGKARIVMLQSKEQKFSGVTVYTRSKPSVILYLMIGTRTRTLNTSPQA